MSDLAPDSSAESPPPQKADPSGWRVDPAPDGRGSPPESKPPMIPRSRLFIAILLGLLVVNLVISFVTSGPAGAPADPYQPFFVDQVKAGNVSEISSQEDSIEGEMKQRGDLRPARRRQARDGHELRDRGPRLHRSRSGHQAARPGRTSSSTPRRRTRAGRCWARSCSASSRRSCSWRSSSGWRAARWGRRGRRARRLRPLHGAARASPASRSGSRFDDVAGIDEAEDELVEVVDFLKNPQRYTKLGRARPARRAALRAARNRQDAARPRGRGRGGRRLLLHVGLGVRRGDRGRRRLARARPVQAGQGGGAGDRLHRRAGRDRPLALGQRGRDQRRPRRARADAQPDPHRDGRLRGRHERDRPGRHEPPRGPRPGAAAPGPLRPADRGPAARPQGPRRDPEDPYPLGAARARRRPRPRSRPRRRARPAPTSRCSSTRRRCSPPAAITPRWSSATSPTRSRRSSSAPSARW